MTCATLLRENERLTALLTKKREAVTRWKTQLNDALGEIERLRAALQSIIDREPATQELTVANDMADEARRALENKP